MKELDVPLWIAGLGPSPMEFLQEERSRIDTLLGQLEANLPDRATNYGMWAYRSIGQIKLRLGRYEEALKWLEHLAAPQNATNSCALYFKAACLSRLGRQVEARAVFQKAEAETSRQLPQPLREKENFLAPSQIYELLRLPREVQALLDQADSKQRPVPR